MAHDGDDKDVAAAVRRQRTTNNNDNDNNNHQHQTTFPSLCTSIGIDSRLRKALARMNLVHPTLVQSKAIPLAISSGRDLLVRARTGSGKTLAYCIPVLQRILARKILLAERGGDDDDDDDEKKRGGTGCSVGGVILVPTRELCDQVSRVLDDLSYYCADVVKVVTLSSSTPSGGGRNGGSAASNKARKEMLRQDALLRDRPDVIVATPAGLVAHVRLGALDLKRTVETLVVDEADLILSFGEFVYMCGSTFIIYLSVYACFLHYDYQAISSVGGIQPKFMTRQFACII